MKSSVKQALHCSASLHCHKWLIRLSYYKSFFQFPSVQRLVQPYGFHYLYSPKNKDIHPCLPCLHMPSHIRACQQPIHFSSHGFMCNIDSSNSSSPFSALEQTAMLKLICFTVCKNNGSTQQPTLKNRALFLGCCVN